tara:strand:+ start:19452 stop:19925 length:474 start_codon:yes stop_codon:yes gene_type:complete
MPRPTEGTEVYVYNALDYVVPFFCKYNIHPNVITGIAFLLNFLLLSNISPVNKMVVVIISRILDSLDGEVARKCDKQSTFGSYLDSISDIVFSVIILMFIFGIKRNSFNIISLCIVTFFITSLFADHSNHNMPSIFLPIHDNTTLVSTILACIAFFK